MLSLNWPGGVKGFSAATWNAPGIGLSLVPFVQLATGRLTNSVLISGPASPEDKNVLGLLGTQIAPFVPWVGMQREVLTGFVGVYDVVEDLIFLNVK